MTAKDERDRIVAWLRERAEHHQICHETGVTAINHQTATLVVTEYAAAIERGEHLSREDSTP